MLLTGTRSPSENFLWAVRQQKAWMTAECSPEPYFSGCIPSRLGARSAFGRASGKGCEDAAP